MNSELNEQQSMEVIQYVKDCIIEHKRKTFDITNIPVKIDRKTAKGILDPIYKTVKLNTTSNQEQKNVAIKILKSIILKTKGTSIINLFLICQLWDFFCQQYRSYKKNNQSPDFSYPESYYELLEDMLQNFALHLGRDNNNKETPFSLYWKAVQNEKKNSYMTKFVLHMSLLTPQNKEALHYIKDHYKNYQNREECKYFIRQFFEKYQKKSKFLNEFLNLENPNFKNCFQSKYDFFKFCDREFFFGHIDDEVYDDYQKIINLEKIKFENIQHNNTSNINSQSLRQPQISHNHSQVSAKQPLMNQSLLSQNEQIQQKNIQKETSIAMQQQYEEPQSFEKPQIKIHQNQNILNSENDESFIENSMQQEDSIQKNTTVYDRKNTSRHNSYIQHNNSIKPNQSYFKKKYDLNLEKEVSQIHNDSVQVDLQSENHSYRQVLNLLSRGLEISSRRLQLQKSLSKDDLCRMKSFAFIEKSRLFSDNHIKIGVKILKDFGHNKYQKIIIVQCFWETMFENIKNIQANIKHTTEKFFVSKKPNLIEFECKNFYQDLNFPKLHLVYTSNNQIYNIEKQILIPINKFMFIPKQSPNDISKFQNKGYKVLISDQYPLDVNFFKRLKELKFVFKNFQEISPDKLVGVFYLQYLVDVIYMEIKVFEDFTFVVQLRYFPNGIEEFLQSFLQEIVFLLSEYGNANYQLIFSINLFKIFAMLKKTKRMFSSLLSYKSKQFIKKRKRKLTQWSITLCTQLEALQSNWNEIGRFFRNKYRTKGGIGLKQI